MLKNPTEYEIDTFKTEFTAISLQVSPASLKTEFTAIPLQVFLLHYQVFLPITAKELWWMSQE
jgi:hypothetical protein